MADHKKGDGLANAYLGLALGAPVLGMLILAIGVFFPKDMGKDVAWWTTLVAFPVLVIALLLIVPLTNADRTE